MNVQYYHSNKSSNVRVCINPQHATIGELNWTLVKTNLRTPDVLVASWKSLCEADQMQTRAAVVCPTGRELQSYLFYTCSALCVCDWSLKSCILCFSCACRKQKAAVATEARPADTPQTKHIPEGIRLNRNRDCSAPWGGLARSNIWALLPGQDVHVCLWCPCWNGNVNLKYLQIGSCVESDLIYIQC